MKFFFNISFLALLFLFSTLELCAQKINIDSLIQFANKLPEDTTKAEVIIDISSEYRNRGNTDKAFEYAGMALKLSEKIKFRRGVAGANSTFGVIYSGIGNYSKALEYHFESLKNNEQLKDKNGISGNYGNIGVIYKEQGNFDKALEYYGKALVINQEIKRNSGLAANYGNMGLIYSRIEKFDKALEYYQKSLEISEKLKNNVYIANNIINIAGIYFRLLEKTDINNKKDFDSLSSNALFNFKKAQNLYEEVNNKMGVTRALGNIGTLYLFIKDFKNAEQFLMKSDSLGKQLNYQEVLKNNYKAESELYEKMGVHDKALEFYKNHVLLKDSLNNDAVAKKSMQLELQYNYEKLDAISKAEIEKSNLLIQKNKQTLLLLTKENELKEMSLLQNKSQLKQQQVEAENQNKAIELLNKNKAIKEIEAKQKEGALRQQRMFTLASICVGILFLCLLLIAIKGYINKQKTNLVISKQKKEVELQKSLIEVKNKEIIDSIVYAKRIQEAILPSMQAMNMALKNGFVYYAPKDVVAGDFYWMEHYKNLVYFAVADCTGHGVPGAMMSVVCSNALSKALLEEGKEKPGELLDKTREIVIKRLGKSGENVNDGMDVALCVLDGNKMYYAGANNPLWIIRPIPHFIIDEVSIENTKAQTNKSGYEFIEYKADKQPIGQYAEHKPFTTHNIDLLQGDTLYIFSDGLVDQFGGEKGKKFKSSRLKELLFSIQSESMDTQKDLILKSFDQWKGDLEQVDDVCIIGVRI